MIAQKLAEKSWHKWMCLALSMMIIGINFIGQQILSPLLGQIGADIDMSNTQVGLLTSSYLIAGIFSPMIIATLYGKWGVRTVILVGGSFLLSGLALFMIAQNYSALLAGRFIAGIGATAFMTSPLVILNHAFRRGKIGMAVGIYGIAPPLASFVSLNVFARLGLSIGWRGAIAVIMALVALVLCLAVMLLHLPELEKARKTGGSPDPKPGLGRGIWLVAALAFAFGYCGLPYITFSPRFYQSHGYSPDLASFIPSLYMGLNILFAPFVGMLFDRDRENKRRQAVLGLALLGVLDLLMISPISTKAFFGVLMGVCTTAPPLAMFSLYVDILPPERIAVGTCIISMIQNLGMAIGPVLTGAMLDGAPGYTGMFLSMALVFWIAAFSMSRLKLNTRTSLKGE